MRTSLSLVALSLVLVAGCADGGGSKAPNGSGGSGVAGAGRGGTTASAGAPNGTGGSANATGGSASGTGGSANGTGGSAGGAGGSAGGGQSGGAGSPAAGGGGGNPGGKAGAPGAGESGGSATSGGAGGGATSGGAMGAGAGGTPSAGTGGAGGATCSRDLLKSTVAAYFTALAAHDPSSLPLDANVKFTENAKVMTLGQMGLWMTAGKLKGSFSAYDTETCNSATQAVVPDGNTDIPVSVRLKLVEQKLTEIETLAVRAGDYKVSGSNFNSDTKALLASIDSVHWEAPVPAAMQNTRDEITQWVTKYFVDFPNGVCNTTSSCKRLENGGGSFSCSAGAGCMTGDPAKPVITPRLIIVDTEAGLGVGFDLFQGAYDDTHLFKMAGGMVSGVSAILGGATSTGWE